VLTGRSLDDQQLVQKQNHTLTHGHIVSNAVMVIPAYSSHQFAGIVELGFTVFVWALKFKSRIRENDISGKDSWGSHCISLGVV
jgi:hypothetical protein